MGEVGLLSSETRAQDGQVLSPRQETAKGRAEGKELFQLVLETKGSLSSYYGFVLFDRDPKVTQAFLLEKWYVNIFVLGA